MVEQKSGLKKRKFPTVLKSVNVPSLSDWRAQNDGYFFDSRESLCLKRMKDDRLEDIMSHIIKGDVLFFSKTWKPLGLEYDWVTNPETGYKYDKTQHWTKIDSLTKEAGDIKFVWEKSRFSWLLTICRYDYHFDEDHSEFVVNQILDWIEKNPLNCGPNYKCSQETSLRLNNWIFALHFYKHSEALTENSWNKIITSIYWQIHHVYQNINYSRIAVRNNHAITETLTLYLMGLMFPMMKGAEKWKKNGKQWFEQEIEYQFEPDGTYLQQSMNYQRVVTQLLTYAIAIADAHHEIFGDVVYDRAYKSLNFLYQCQEPTNGWLPNYGANDGALFFPLSTADYRDYRPQLDALHGLLTGQPLYDDYLEDSLWVGHTVPSFRRKYATIEKQYGIVFFEKSGFYLIRESKTLTFIRCGKFKRGGSTDQLHIDVWYDGKNVLMDGGSYLYNTNAELTKYFGGTESHNTIMLDKYDQMLKGPRFMWFYPPVILSAKLREEYFEYTFEGKIIAFKQVKEDGVEIYRTVKKTKGRPEWIITDTIQGAPADIIKRQLWHTEDIFKTQDTSFQVEIESDGEIREDERWTSDYYGEKRSIRQVEVDTKTNQIKTIIKIKK